MVEQGSGNPGHPTVGDDNLHGPAARQLRRRLSVIAKWFVADGFETETDGADDGRRIDVVRVVPFVALHLACICVVWVGWSPTAVAVALFLYALRMFAITGFYHRYFSHRAFSTSRAAQFVFAVIGASAVQRGPLWWAAHHRHHHTHADQDEDAHSPVKHGLWWSHAGWFLCRANFATRTQLVKDWMKFPELRFLDRFDILVPGLLAAAMYASGLALEHWAPHLGVSGAQLLVWGFVISTIALYHATFTVNSLAHVWGSRRYDTRDQSRNNVWLAVLTFGEGWHNNHHHYSRAARQGFFWWEIDLTYYLLKLLAWVGLIWDLKGLPADIRNFRRLDRARPN